MDQALQTYTDHLERLGGNRSTWFTVPDIPSVRAVLFNNVPIEGTLTIFTYGLSLVCYPQWDPTFRPELFLSVESGNTEWAHFLLSLTDQMRGVSSFRYGDMIRFGGRPLTSDTNMSAILIHGSTLIPAADLTVTLPQYVLYLMQVYPIYQEEIPIVEKFGPAHFIQNCKIDFYDVNRKPLEVFTQ